MLTDNERETLEIAASLSRLISAEVKAEVTNLVEHGEPGVALEPICDHLEDRDVPVGPEHVFALNATVRARD